MNKTLIFSLALVLLRPTELHKEKITYEEPKVLTVKLASKDLPIEKKEEIKKKERIYIPVELTGYDNCYKCTQNSKAVGVTASGVRASRGTLAVPKQIPLGSTLYINGVPHRAEDRGGAIKVRPDGTYIFDVWFKTHQEALDFGRVKAKMYIEDNKYYIEF